MAEALEGLAVPFDGGGVLRTGEPVPAVPAARQHRSHRSGQRVDHLRRQADAVSQALLDPALGKKDGRGDAAYLGGRDPMAAPSVGRLVRRRRRRPYESGEGSHQLRPPAPGPRRPVHHGDDARAGDTQAEQVADHPRQ